MHSKKKNKLNLLKQRICIALLIIIILMMALSTGFSNNKSSQDSIQVIEQVISIQAEENSIYETLIAGGSLVENLGINVKIAGDMEIERYLVTDGDYVEEGQSLALIDKNSVVDIIYKLSSLIKEMDADIERSAADAAPTRITAPAAGRIKAVYVQPGDNVLDVMYEHSALMLMSLDGLMAVDIPGNISIGTTLIVRLSDGTELPARVSKSSEDIVTVTCSDEKTPLGSQVEIYSSDGEKLGSGELYIHRELKISGFAGTVNTLYATTDAAVSAGNLLISLKDTNYTGKRDSLLKQRREFEEEMAVLFEIWQSGTVLSPTTGRVSNLNAKVLAEPISATFGTHIEPVNLRAVCRPQLTLLSSVSEPIIEQANVVTEQIGRVSSLDLSTFELIVTLSDGIEIRIPFTQFGNESAQVGDLVVIKYTNGQITGIQVFRSGAADASGEEDYSPEVISVEGGAGASTPTEEAQKKEKVYSIGETLICTVTPYDSVTSEFTVDEIDVDKIYINMPISVTLDALPEQHFEAVLKSINPKGTNDGGSTKYTATAYMGRNQFMFAGMNCNLYMNTGEHTGITIPVCALEEREDGTYVYTGYDSKNNFLINAVPVTTGYSDGESAIITSGLNVGDTIYYRYSDSIQYNFSR